MGEGFRTANHEAASGRACARTADDDCAARGQAPQHRVEFTKSRPRARGSIARSGTQRRVNPGADTLNREANNLHSQIKNTLNVN